MSLRIRHLEIRVLTEKGTYGVRLPFGDGLVVLRAENSSGKSTCLMSILYALGLEGMLGPSHVPPLSEAMVRRITGEDGKPKNVLESHVLLEIENGQRGFMTVKRQVTGTNKQRDLIVAFDGPLLTNPSGAFEHRSFFVRIPGAAQSDVGFHTRLAEFMGLNLPQVPRYDGPPVPLYLECLFPFLFVEQITGWQGLEARMPTHFRIVEPWQRAMEFLLKFDARGSALQRHQLQIKKRELEQLWDRTLHRARIATQGIGFVPTGLPPLPVAEWPPMPPPAMRVTDGTNWLSVGDTLERWRNSLASLNSAPIPTTEEAAKQVAAELAEAEGALDETELEFESLYSKVRLDQEQLAAIDKRLDSLKHDLQEYKDEQRLRERDSLSRTGVAKGECRVCGQPIKDTLAAQTKALEPMPLLQNIAFLNDQMVLFEEMRADAARTLEGKQQALISLRHRTSELQAIIRTQRETLRGSANSPSAAAVRERLVAEDRIRRLEASKAEFDEVLLEFEAQARDWAKLQADLRATKADSLTLSDRAKLNRLRESFIDQLSSYGFRSFSPEEIVISYRHFRPIREENDLWGMSASDTIRTIWAYLVGLLEVARNGDTNHPGLLILDEPRQQSADKVSFGALLKRVAGAKASAQQVIFATSEDEKSLRAMLEGLPHELLTLPDRVLQPLPEGN